MAATPPADPSRRHSVAAGDSSASATASVTVRPATSLDSGGPLDDGGSLVLVGGGRMGQAFISGLLAGRAADSDGADDPAGGDRSAAALLRPSQVTVVEPYPPTRAWWARHQPQCRLVDNLADALQDAAVVLVAVKPDQVLAVATEAAGQWGGKLVISVAAGVTLDKLISGFATTRVIRVMPNTPCLVGAGASAYCCGAGVSAVDKQTAGLWLSALGLAIEVSEPQMDAVTGLSGSGPAYVCVMIEALADGGVLAGLPRATAMQLATQTVLGTAQMIRQLRDQHPAQLKDAVASPGGTTIAGLRALEQNGVRSGLIEAVAAAAKRSGELG